MNKSFVSIALVALCALASGAALAGATELRAEATGNSIQLVGTLAPVNSLEFRAAPLYTSLANYRFSLITKVTTHKVSVEVGQAGQVAADAVRATLDNALRACAQDNHTGKCTGDAKTAEGLLKIAKEKLHRLH